MQNLLLHRISIFIILKISQIKSQKNNNTFEAFFTLARDIKCKIEKRLVKVSKSQKQFIVKWILQKNERWISALED